MNIYDKINAIFSTIDISNERPLWVDEILKELAEIKNLGIQTQNTTSKLEKEYYYFVKQLRIQMRADTSKNIYPEIRYNNKRLGIDFNGYLYDKDTLKILSTQDAFKVYRYLYDYKQKHGTINFQH